MGGTFCGWTRNAKQLLDHQTQGEDDKVHTEGSGLLQAAGSGPRCRKTGHSPAGPGKRQNVRSEEQRKDKINLRNYNRQTQ